ncbi:MAG: type II toxin-antitoxin system VapB family antitoxin [Microvirga sp.]
MAMQIKDKTMLRQIERLSQMRGMSKTEVLRTALAREIDRDATTRPVGELLAPLLARVRALGPVDPMASGDGKRMSDELWGEG